MSSRYFLAIGSRQEVQEKSEQAVRRRGRKDSSMLGQLAGKLLQDVAYTDMPNPGDVMSASTAS